MSVRSRLVLLAALALAALPGSLTAQSAARLEPGCTRQRMQPARQDRDRRRPAEVRRDSLARAMEDSVRAGILDAARASGVAEPAGDVVIEFQDRATGAARAFAGANVPVETIQAAVDRAAPLLAQWPGQTPQLPGQSEILHLRLDAPPPASGLAAGAEFVECRPLLLNTDEIRAGLDGLVRANRASLPRPVHLTVTYLVDRTGRVFYARILRGRAEPAVLDAVLALTRTAVMRPASVAGRPVSVWAAQEYTLSLPR